MKGRAPLSASMMAKDKIRTATIKVGILLELSTADRARHIRQQRLK
jgi:hypothetical protein